MPKCGRSLEHRLELPRHTDDPTFKELIARVANRLLLHMTTVDAHVVPQLDLDFVLVEWRLTPPSYGIAM